MDLCFVSASGPSFVVLCLHDMLHRNTLAAAFGDLLCKLVLRFVSRGQVAEHHHGGDPGTFT